MRTVIDTVWSNPGGIREALEAFRKDGFAATQADLVCHSQGGVIARRYAKGTASDQRLPDDDYHCTNPRECSRGACCYHRFDNFARGDIHRLITLSSTHLGSDTCSTLGTFIELRQEGKQVAVRDELCATLALLGAGHQGNSNLSWLKEFVGRLGHGQLTSAYKDQISPPVRRSRPWGRPSSRHRRSRAPARTRT